MGRDRIDAYLDILVDVFSSAHEAFNLVKGKQSEQMI